MMKIGIWNTLTVLRDTKFGLFLGDDEGNDVLLPNKYCPKDAQVGDQVEVFLYLDSEERIIATNLHPYITLHKFAGLEVRHVTTVGAFLDWGLEKDLLCPYREQDPRMEVGERHVVYMYVDEKTGRLVATNRIRRYLSNEEMLLEPGEEVHLLVWEETAVGFRVIVNHRHMGMVYRSELFQPLKIGDRITGFVKAIREDKKLDISLQKQGFEHVEDQTKALLDRLTQAGGMLPIGDKSTPEEILRLLAISKKTFKKAAGILMKAGKAVIEDHHIILTPTKKSEKR